MNDNIPAIKAVVNVSPIVFILLSWFSQFVPAISQFVQRQLNATPGSCSHYQKASALSIDRTRTRFVSLLLPRRGRHNSVVAVISHEIAEMPIAVRNHVQPELDVLRVRVILNRFSHRHERLLDFLCCPLLRYEGKEFFGRWTLPGSDQRLLLLLSANQRSGRHVL